MTKKRKCSICGQTGHNARTCKAEQTKELERQEAAEKRLAEEVSRTFHAMVDGINTMAERAGVGMSLECVDATLGGGCWVYLVGTEVVDYDNEMAVACILGAIAQATEEPIKCY